MLGIFLICRICKFYFINLFVRHDRKCASVYFCVINVRLSNQFTSVPAQSDWRNFYCCTNANVTKIVHVSLGIGTHLRRPVIGE